MMNSMDISLKGDSYREETKSISFEKILKSVDKREQKSLDLESILFSNSN